MNKITLLAAAALAASCATAQTTVAQEGAEGAPPPPPCSGEKFRQFDFWAGEWEVFGKNPKGETVKGGDNTITIEEDGCLLVEHWKDTRGGTGQSYNYVNLADGKWRQIWVSSWGTIDYAGGLNEDGAMVLEGEIAYPDGNKAPFRGTWTPNDDGTVTQYFQQYDPEKEEWMEWFTGTYVPKKKTDE